MSKIISAPIGILIIVIVAILAGVILIWQYSSFTKDANMPPIDLLFGRQEQADTLDWKTYRNEKYGFEVRYPKEWEPLEGATYTYKPPTLKSLLSVCFAPETRRKFSCEVQLYITNEVEKFSDPNKFLGRSRCAQEKTYSPNFGGLRGIEVDVCEDGSVILKNDFVRQGKLVYLLVASKLTPQTIERFRSMLASFKFAGPSTPIDTSTWKTYRNEQYGFEVRYPPYFQEDREPSYEGDKVGEREGDTLLLLRPSDPNRYAEVMTLSIIAEPLSNYKFRDPFQKTIVTPEKVTTGGWWYMRWMDRLSFAGSRITIFPRIHL